MKNPIPSIHELRKQGYKVRVTHHRYVSHDPDFHYVQLVRLTKEDKKLRKYTHILPKGGYTNLEVTAEFKTDKPTHSTNAICSSQDAFNRKFGLQLCLNRLRLMHAI
jgi:hypothetical protein